MLWHRLLDLVELWRKCYIHLGRCVLTVTYSIVGSAFGVRSRGEVMKKSQVVAAAFVATAIASPVFAADLLKAPAPALVAPSWSGWYIGGEVGEKWVTNDWSTNCIQGGGTATCGSALNRVPFQGFPGAPDSSASFKPSGVRGGVYAGAMFQFNPSWVIGVEGDYAFY